MTHTPAALALLLVATYVDRDGAHASTLINELAGDQLQQMLHALGDLAQSTRLAVNDTHGHVPGIGTPQQLDERVHEVIGQVTTLDAEAALQSYLQRPRDTPGQRPTASYAEITAMIHAAAAYTAVLMESRPIPPTVLAAGLRDMAHQMPKSAP